jgi:hypothetical protein
MEQPSVQQLQEAGEALSKWLGRNRAAFPLNRDFAQAVGRSEPWLSKVLKGAKPVEPADAKLIHVLTSGRVPGSLLRPDLWRLPQHVPVEPQRRAS